jgi:hypothetical protein
MKPRILRIVYRLFGNVTFPLYKDFPPDATCPFSHIRRGEFTKRARFLAWLTETDLLEHERQMDVGFGPIQMQK